MRTVLLLSGGLDSSVLLAQLLNQGHEVAALSLDYGQRHVRELDAARFIAKRYGVRHKVLALPSLATLWPESVLTGAGAVPDGHYAADSMKATVVPNRNMFLLSLALGWAGSLKFDAVAYSAHGGDHAIYPDCRPEFFAAMDAAARFCDWQPLQVLAPFITASKADIVKVGAALGVPFAQTRTCYNDGLNHCGRCGACTERREAFKLAGVSDPTMYCAT